MTPTGLQAYDDAEQAWQLSHPPIILFCDDQERVIAGPFRGRDAGAVAQQVVRGHLEAGLNVMTRYTFLRPWWRLWRATRAIRIVVQPRALEFEQDFDDGGAADD